MISLLAKIIMISITKTYKFIATRAFKTPKVWLYPIVFCFNEFRHQVDDSLLKLRLEYTISDLSIL